jgi:hypothetical protein
MDRPTEMKVAQALNEAIWLRDNVTTLDKEELLSYLRHLGSLGVFSSRQLSAIVNGLVPHTTISKIIDKNDKTGGKLNVGTLDILRTILINRADSTTDFRLILEAVGQGTSQGMVSKLTGINQSTISKKVREANGL